MNKPYSEDPYYYLIIYDEVTNLTDNPKVKHRIKSLDLRSIVIHAHKCKNFVISSTPLDDERYFEVAY